MAFIKTVSPEKAEGKIAELYAPVLEMIGSVPKSLEMWSASPTLLELQMGFMGYFMQHQTLDPNLTTLIRYLVAKECDHQYCVNFNGQMLTKMGGISEDQLKAIGANPKEAPLDEKGKAMLLFVLKALKSPETVEAKDLDSLRNLGWTDQDIYEATVHGANMVLSGTLFKAFRMGEE
jgi:alkylhydroperoxidase family enzyme